MFLFDRKSSLVIFSAIAVLGIQFASTEAFAINDNSTQTPAQRLCWQMTKSLEFHNKIDPNNLVEFSKKDNKYIPFAFTAKSEVVCLPEGVKWIDKVLDESGKENSYELYFTPTETGGVLAKNNSYWLDFSGDGLSNFKVVSRSSRNGPTIYNKPVSINDTFATVMAFNYHNVECDKSLEQLKGLGVESVLSETLLGSISWEENYKVKINSLVSYKWENESDFSFLYQTNKPEISFTCNLKIAKNPQITNNLQ